MHAQLFSKMDYSPEAYGMTLASHIMGWCPLPFDSQRTSLSAHVPQGWEMYDPLIFSQGLVPLCPCHKNVQCPVIYPISVAGSYTEVHISKYRQESSHKYVVLEPIYLLLQEM